MQELLDADELRIATPVCNYNIPASLIAWIDHIVRKRLTLGFDGSGLVSGKKATIVIASGGVYGEGSPVADRNIAPRYMKLILNVIGITDVDIIHGQGGKAVDPGEATMEEFVEGYAGRMKQLAAPDIVRGDLRNASLRHDVRIGAQPRRNSGPRVRNDPGSARGTVPINRSRARRLPGSTF